MYLKSLELTGFKSFGKKSALEFSTATTAIVGPNGSGKSNTAEAFRFVLGEQSIKSLRGKRGEDLIWGGSATIPRGNRASVKVVFDNSKRLLGIDFDEVVLERVVYRDGTNEYSINNSRVRLKDIHELLAAANIGSSGHHIISQGEADRVLSASPKERRQMIEDALGLRSYQYKKEESRKKLLKTQENRTQVEALRKENLPHLRFLEKQMHKLERARELREQLVTYYQEYLRREEQYLAYEKESIQGFRDVPKHELRTLDTRLRVVRQALEDAKAGGRDNELLLSLERDLSRCHEKIAADTRTLGRLEGQIAFEERRLADEAKRVTEEEGKPIPFNSVREFWEALTAVLSQEAGSTSPEHALGLLAQARSLVARFKERHETHASIFEPDRTLLDRLLREKEELEHDNAKRTKERNDLEERMRAAQQEVEKGKDENRDMEREMFALLAKQSELRAELSKADSREQMLLKDEEEFKRELQEAVVLVGRRVLGYKDAQSVQDEPLALDNEQHEQRDLQHTRRRDLERLKVRLEEMGGASADEITKEYTEANERDQFLTRELEDLERSTESLTALIEDLERELNQKFLSGVAEITKQFSSFFTLMFGGGSASLHIVKERKRGTVLSALFGDGGEEEPVPAEHEGEPEGEDGIDVEVSLPKKRIQSLLQLSGGERTLTSIALIFAMSQVNPPPFLILDETDAALDEANSRRYGDMIENLSKKSQLILITHNRETMSRAGILYGVTMGNDGVSKLLSVKFDDAVSVAK